ncbi:MAG: HlyD family efflux transporter periplasmic adaptor subunit [Bacteroidota bacterium]
MKRSFILLSLCGALFSLSLTSCGKVTAETKPIRKDVTETVFASGSLQAEGTYQLTARTAGYISELAITDGDIVKKGMVLAVIDNQENFINTRGASELLDIAKSNTQEDSPLLQQAEYAIKINRQKMEQDQKTEQRYKRLLASNSIARIDYENALLAYQTSVNNYESAVESYQQLKRDAEQQVVNNQTSVGIYSTALGNNQVKALSRGKVYQTYKEVGDYVRQGDVIALIGSPDVLYAEVNIDESNIARIQVGQEAVIELNTHPGETLRGTVKEINPSFNQASQSFICKLYFADSLGFQIVNTQLQTNIVVGEQQSALLIPRNYLDFGGYVQIKGQEEKTKVSTQFVSNEWVQVLSGIDENTILVTDNLITQN